MHRVERVSIRAISKRAGLHRKTIRRALAAVVRRVIDAGIPLEGAADHGVSEAVYLRDPDGNGVELYRDRPEKEWPRAPDGQLVMYTRPLDLAALVAAQ